ncbi:MAG: aromatic ring-hydroxylating dioxygenase subunit alpha [Acidimicrobiia bacterium]
MSLPGSLRAEDLERSCERLDRARMLPGAAYTETSVLEWEREHLFGEGWVAVAHASAVAESGAQVAVEVAGTSAVVVRGGDGALRAFANTCRHRGHELLPVGAEACRPSLRCPYHGWAYDLDGRLRHATGGLRPDPDALALVGLRVAEHLGFVFVNAGGGAAPVEAVFGGAEALLGAHDAGGLVPVVQHVYEVRANWKVVHENYQECLHCPQIHPELSRVSPPDSGDNVDPGPAWVGGWMDLAGSAMTMSMTGEAVAAPLPGLDERRRRRVAYVALLPSLLVSAHPDYVLTHRLEPLAPDATRVTCEWLAAPGTTTEDLRAAIELWDVTNRQDWDACASVQRGLTSPWFVPGPLAPREDAVHRVVTWFASEYLTPAREDL